jgi:hypothetical protein
VQQTHTPHHQRPWDAVGWSLANTGRASRHQRDYSIQGGILSPQGALHMAHLNEASVNAEIALQNPAGRIITIAEVSGERFAGQNTSTAARALTKAQASDASS